MLRTFIQSETAEQQTRDLVTYCHQNHVREIILFNGSHADMGWNFATLEEAEARVGVLKTVFLRLREAGLQPSINMWTTLGHWDMGQDERGRFPWQFMVGEDGAESHAIPCPLDPNWKHYIGELYGLFAQLQPEIIYIDDDFRYQDHYPVSWGCFCPLHLQEMARRTGTYLQREELVHRILTAEPQPTKEREQWLKLCGDSLIEAIRIMTQAVMKASPRTHMGLMCEDPNEHATQGENWEALISALFLTGNHPVIRPQFASYEEERYRDTAAELAPMRKLQPLLGNKARVTPELDNHPDTRFSKSVNLTRLQMALSFFLAPPDITINIHNFVEPRLDYDIAHDRMLRESFDYFNAITRWAEDCPKERGLQILWNDRLPLRRVVEVDRMTALTAPRCWEGAMDLFGFATTFYPDKIKLASISYIAELADSEIHNMLKGSILMDGSSAKLLIERGFGRDIGLRACEPVGPTNYERMTNARFAGEFLNRAETTMHAHKYRLEPVVQAIVVSRMFGPAASFSVPGMVLYENSYGGRIGVIPQDGSRGDFYIAEFRGWKRQYVLKKMLEWIGGGPLPLFVEDAPDVLPLRRDSEDAILIGLANLAGDPLPQVKLHLSAPFRRRPIVEHLSLSGKRSTPTSEVTFGGGYLSLKIAVTVQPLELACFRLRQT